jgi:hypothetical protein
MYQVPAAVWNQIAETQRLETSWAKWIFPLPEDDQEKAVLDEELRLTKPAGSALLAMAYLTVAPLLWERRAIRLWKTENGENPGLPSIETVQEAVILASKDHRLTVDQQRTLSAMLSTPPSLP